MEKILVSLFLLFSFGVFAQDTHIHVDIKQGTSLKDFIRDIEAEYHFLFSYKEEDVLKVVLKENKQEGNISEVLTSVLQNTALQFRIVGNKYIVLSQKNQLSEQQYLTLCGQVIDSLTQQPLAFANIYLLKGGKGTTTEADGRFELQVPTAALDTLVLSYVGYEECRLPLTAFANKPCREIALSYLDLGDDFIVVTEYLTEGIELTNNTLTTQIQPNKSGLLPGQAEPDILETLQLLPGISSTDGTASGLSIRGGTADQNLILWENIPIYHTAHYFGTISAFNPYIIDKVSVYRGGFDASYGGRVSGVIDIKSADWQHTISKYAVGINFLNFYANGSTALANNKLKLIYSARRSISELWRSPAYENLTRRIQQGVLVQNVDLDHLPKEIHIKDRFIFFDSNLKLNYQLSEHDNLTVAGFYGYNDFGGEVMDDKLMQRQTDTLYLFNNGLSATWQHRWNKHWDTRLLAVHSNYAYNYEYSLLVQGQQIPNKQGHKKSEILEQKIQLENRFTTNRARSFAFGYELGRYETDFSLVKKTISDNPNITQQFDKSNLHVLYGTFQSEKEADKGLEAGLRFSYYEWTKQPCLEPRLRLWYQPVQDLNIQIAGGKYCQFLTQLYEIQGDNSSISTPVWTLAGRNDSPVLDALQFQVGIVLQKKTWLLDVQLYAKRISGLTSLSSDYKENLSNRFHIGDARIRGVDILLKKRWGNFRTWISYTLSTTEYLFPSFFDQEFPGPFDQRHIFNWSNAYSFRQWEFSLGWKISSGNPYSLLENYELRTAAPGQAGPKEYIEPVVNEFNSEYLPSNHQLDAAIRYTFLPKSHNKWKTIVGLSLLNIYDQRNIYSREFNIRHKPNLQSVLEYTDKVTLGFTPNMVVRLEW